MQLPRTVKSTDSPRRRPTLAKLDRPPRIYAANHTREETQALLKHRRARVTNMRNFCTIVTQNTC